MTIPMTGDTYNIFISYRRKGGDLLARLLYETFRHRKYSIFFDYESLSSGVFGEKILGHIRNAKDVLVVLSEGCLERCNNPGDWMLQEIAEAIKYDKNIVLVFAENFHVPTEEELRKYPQEIRTLLDYQGYVLSIEHFDDTIKRICDGLLSQRIILDEKDLRKSVSYLLQDNAVSLTEEEKSGFLDSILTSRHGSKVANALQSFLETNPRHYRNVRTKFNYEISLDSEFSFGALDIDSQRYFKLTEALSYQKHFLTASAGETYWISFIRDLDQVDEGLRNEEFIFSENLLMDKADLLALAVLDPEEQRDFYLKRMRVRFNLNSKVLTPAELIINESGIFAKYIKDDENAAYVGVLDVKLAFSIPHRKVSSYFFASISDPTYSPHISFTYPDDEVDVEMISFMNRHTTTTDAKIFEGLREVSFDQEWVLPMSGVVFIMNPIV